ncbi:MAG: hypothetical protein Q8M07_31820 [Prosthecobacter sp.]|nr:hypothetical protein [Prosthecobacter sp.]
MFASKRFAATPSQPLGNRLFSAGQEGVVRVIDAGRDRVLHSWQAANDWICRLAPSPDGRHLSTSGWNGEVKVWNLTEMPGLRP